MKKIKIIAIIAVGLFIVSGTFIYLFYTGVLLFNNPPAARYPVRGVDVSSYQGAVDWEVMASQNIRFAFIKATEGSGSIDPYFRENYQNAAAAGLRVGAYHFFSYDSGGAAQADNFIAAVEKTDNMLPPVVDVEFYGDYNKHPLPKEQVKPQLEAYIAKVKAAYGVDPILYATGKSYALYLKGEFPDCDIWIRDVFFTPSLPDGRGWTFWQYADKGRLKGYSGKEKYIDLNVFYGTEEQFEGYGK